MNGHTRKQCLVVLAVMLVTLSGCGVAVPAYALYEMLDDASPEEFWTALPSVDDLSTVGPIANASESLKKQRNGSDWAQNMERIHPAFTIINALTENTLPDLNENTATWTSVPSLTKGIVWRLVVRKTGHATWEYSLSGKDKAAPDSAFAVVFSGRTERTAERVMDENGNERVKVGVSGSVHLNWDASTALPEDPALGTKANRLNGTGEITFSRTEEAHDVDMGVAHSIPGDVARDAEISTHYHQTASGGTLETINVVRSGLAGSAWSSRVRWNDVGAYRHDSMGTESSGKIITSSTCMDAAWTEVYWTNSTVSRQDGNEALCVFGVAAFYQP